MEKFLKPKFSIQRKHDDNNPNSGIFVIEKLEKGFGQTIGTSMRRTIISSIPSSSFFAIEIEGVKHEFQTIENCREDVVELILNLKNVLIETNEDLIDLDEIYEFNLVSKNGDVFAKDIITKEGFKIINGDFKIATTDKDGALSMKLFVTYSRGIKTFEENRIFINEKLGTRIGLIPIDSDFSPIEKVSYNVEIVNPGESKEYERLIFNIFTKGNILPEKVISMAGSILENYFISFKEMFEINLDEQFIEEIIKEEEDEHLTQSIESLNLSVRSENALRAAKISTIEELINRPVSALRDIKNLGEKSKTEIIQVIQDMGLSFKSE